MADLIAATNDILSTLKVAWDAGSRPVIGQDPVTGNIPTIVYEALETDLKPHPRNTTAPWCRITIRHVTARPVGIRNGTGQRKRYRRTGIATIEVYFPFEDGSAWDLSRRLAMLVQAAYQGKRTANAGVVYSAASLKEVGREGSFYCTTVLVNFTWDEVA